MAFKPSGVSSTPVSSVPAAGPVTQAGLDEQEGKFTEVFGREIVAQMRRMLEDVIGNVTRNRSFFRERDLVKGMQKMAQKEGVPTRAMEHPRFVELIDWAIKMRSLVEIGTTNTFTTPEMVEMERSMLEMAGRAQPRHLLPQPVVDRAIAAKKGISEEQAAAVLAACCTPKNLTVIEGAAGAGKSFTMQAIKEAYTEVGYDVMGTALSWNAAKVLESATGMDASKCIAIEGLVRRMLTAREKGTEYFRGPTLLIVDEAGMVGTRHMFHLLAEAARSAYPVKIVLTGDSLQVNPVDAGNALQAIIEYHGTTRIDTIRRQKQVSHRAAVRRFSKREAGKALHTFLHQEAIRWCETQNDQFSMVVRDFLSYRLAHPDRKALILALRNKDVADLNQRLRSAYRKMGLIDPQEIEIRVTDGRESWQAGFSVGDEVVLRSNDVNLMKYHINPALSTVDSAQWLPIERGVFNRNAGRVVGIRRAADPVGSFDLVVDLGGDSPARVILNTETFRHTDRPGFPVVHNFATTIYASQGQTVQQVFLLDSPMMEFRLAYVGMSRHTDGVQIYLNETELHERLDRLMGKAAPASAPERSGRPGEAPELPVQLGRYRRSEMLQTVASCWAKDSENLTAMIYERRKRLGSGVAAVSQEELARVVQADAAEDVIDFVPSLNVPIPVVDLARIMDLPDPIVETVLVRPSEVEANRMVVDPSVIPLRQRLASELPEAPETAPDPPGAFSLSRALQWLGWDPAKAPSAPSADEPLLPDPPPLPLRQPDPVSPFQTAAPAPAEAELVSPAGLLPTGNGAPRRRLHAVPLLPVDPPTGTVDESGMLRFDGVPQTVGAQGGPTDDIVQQFKGHFWDVGRNQEPRILARDHQHAVVARYRLDGKCVVGEGYPPILLNPKGGAHTPIVIVPGAREWFWMAEHQRKRHAQQPEQVPHLVWAANDVDWGLIAKAMRGKAVQIIRSKIDESQLPWALELQKKLASQWGIAAEVLPKPPESAPRRPPQRP